MGATSHYSTKGLYSRYDKNHKERDKLDYYATPPEEVYNILTQLDIDFSNSTILEPCVGGGHMMLAINNYIYEKNLQNVTLIGTDVAVRDEKFKDTCGPEFDFLSDDFPPKSLDLSSVDWIIMNPPYATIEPFTIRALEMANKGVIMLARLQFLEGSGRYENIFKENPPAYVYTYTDRIACFKDGDFSVKPASIQAYSWFIWEKGNTNETIHRWIRRADKQF